MREGEDNTGNGGSKATSTEEAAIAAVAVLLRHDAALSPLTKGGEMEVIVVGETIAGC